MGLVGRPEEPLVVLSKALVLVRRDLFGLSRLPLALTRPVETQQHEEA